MCNDWVYVGGGVAICPAFASLIHLFFIDKVYTFFLSSVFVVHLFKLKHMILLWVDHSREIFLWDMVTFFIILLIIVSFLLQSLPIFGGLWKFFKIIFIVWFAVLGINLAKKSIKSWWND
jgi:hypothetical protein